MHRLLFLLLVSLSLLSNLSAQSYRFRSYGQSQGIEQHFIYTINQAQDGYLLVGTEDGLLKFNGVSFKKIDLIGDTEKPGIIKVSKHVEEAKIWYGYNDGRVILLNLRDYTVVFDSIVAAGSITGIVQDRYRNTWISTINQGLVKIDVKLGVTAFDLQEYEGELQINSINMLPPDELVLGTGSGILSIEASELRGRRSLPKKKIIENWEEPINVLVRAQDSVGLYIGTRENGVWFYPGKKKGGNINQMKLWETNERKNIKALIEAKDKSLWISAGGEGLYKISPGFDSVKLQHTLYDDSNGLLSNSVRSLYNDTEGNIWIGHYGQGLSSFLENFLEFYSVKVEDKIKTVNVLIGMGDDFYIGVDDGLMKVSSGNWNDPQYVFPELKGKKITSIVKGEDGNLWIGSESEGVYKWNYRSGGSFLTHVADNGPMYHINFLLPVKNGIWIASKGGLRYVNYDLSGSVTYTMEDGLPSNNISCLYAEGENIWIASNISVVARFSSGKFEQHILNTGETVVNIIGISADVDGGIWVATDGKGIIRVNGDEPVSLLKASGLESNYCQGILRDKYDNLLVLHRGGISRVWSGMEGIDVLNEDNGIDGEFNQNGIFTDESGNIWLGTTRGVIKYIPDNNSIEDRGPAIHLVSVQVGDQKVDFSKKLDLKYGNHRLEIQYEGISFKNGKNIRYQYILEGYDEDWSAWTKSTTVVYRKLQDGKYRFRVRACLSEDACTTSTSLATINVSPPFWKSWWFYIMGALGMILTVTLIIKVRERNFKETEKYLQSELQDRIKVVIQHEKELEEKNKLLEESVKQKETLLREVHHRVQNNLQLISSLLNLQAKNVDNEAVSKILQNSQSRIGTMALLHEKLYSSEDIGNVPVQDYVENLCQAVADAYETDSCKVKYRIDLDQISCGIDTSVPLGLILNEIITNSYKYAFKDRSEGIIDIKLIHLDGERHKLTIGDNGVGLHEGYDITNSKSLGLQLVNVLTEQLGGNVNCVSTEKGTKFTITFNISAH
ncbi:MAG TPA: hypothetical protein EYN71_03120 [Flavobacteriales bacterium]|nr:hypothetical protein [Flavobacteriales bacterium]